MALTCWPNALIMTAEKGYIFDTPAAIGTAPIVKTMKTGNGSKIN